MAGNIMLLKLKRFFVQRHARLSLGEQTVLFGIAHFLLQTATRTADAEPTDLTSRLR